MTNAEEKQGDRRLVVIKCISLATLLTHCNNHGSSAQPTKDVKDGSIWQDFRIMYSLHFKNDSRNYYYSGHGSITLRQHEHQDTETEAAKGSSVFVNVTPMLFLPKQTN